MYKRKGMKLGGKHDWIYKTHEWKERKITPTLWKFKTGQSKRRSHGAPRNTGMPVGSKLIWGIKARQIMFKKNKDVYTGYMQGQKKLIGFKLPRQKQVIVGRHKK